MNKFSLADLPGRVDYALFAADATRVHLERFCAEAREHSYRSVCVNSSRVELVRTILDDTPLQVVALVGFPLGAGEADARRFETEIAVDAGAHEVDVVLNIGRLKDGDHKYVLRELRDLAESADERPVKVILETHLLTRDEKILACQLVVDSGLHFVSTATDFHCPDVSVEDVALLRETVGEDFGVKAAGNIRDAQQALALLEAGATRLALLDHLKQ